MHHEQHHQGLHEHTRALLKNVEKHPELAHVDRVYLPSREAVVLSTQLLRQLMLAKMLRSDDESAAEAMRLASDLARTMDQLAIEEIQSSTLNDAVSDAPELAGHWLRSIDRFRAVMARWPALLADQGLVDLADRRSKLLNALANLMFPPPR